MQKKHVIDVSNVSKRKWTRTNRVYMKESPKSKKKVQCYTLKGYCKNLYLDRLALAEWRTPQQQQKSTANRKRNTLVHIRAAAATTTKKDNTQQIMGDCNCTMLFYVSYDSMMMCTRTFREMWLLCVYINVFFLHFFASSSSAINRVVSIMVCFGFTSVDQTHHFCEWSP